MHPANQISLKPHKEPATALFHSGLLWKEWRQHRFLFLLFFSLMTLELVFSLFCMPFLASMQQNHVNVSSSFPILAVKAILQNGMSFTENISMIAVVMLAVIMLGKDRAHSLKYLVSTAVSRRQIIAAKWLLGSLVILLAMSVLVSVMYIISAPDPQTVPVQLLLLWGLRMTLALLFLFGLALLSACIFSASLYAAVFTGFFLALPMLLIHIIVSPLAKYHVLSAQHANQVYQWSNVFNIISYVGADGVSGGSGAFIAGISTFILLFLMILCFLFSMRVFEHAPLERNGEILLIGHSKEIGRLVLACLFAPLYAGDLSASWPWFFIYSLLLGAAIYLGLGLLWKLQFGLGLARRAVR
ncbi:MAG: ABC transporter permease subunit [Methanobacterium sp.]